MSADQEATNLNTKIEDNEIEEGEEVFEEDVKSQETLKPSDDKKSEPEFQSADIIEQPSTTDIPFETPSLSIQSGASKPQIHSQESEEQQDRNLIVTDDDDEEEELSLDESESYLKLSGFSIKEFRNLKTELETLIRNKIKNLERIGDKKNISNHEKSVMYYKKFAIDKVGSQVIHGETGVAEGWNVPNYENDFHNLLGLPYDESHALSEALRLRRPRQECFNCLATNHRIQECPAKMDEERIAIHRKLFNFQSMHTQEQLSLFSNRYTSDLDSLQFRGFVPGRISDQLREAFGIKPNQLPPFIYIMRDLGYPKGWLLEAQIKNNKLAVHNGDNVDKENEKIANEGNEPVEYDPERIYVFPGFNEKPPSGTIDESEKFGVRKYGSDLSREKFLGSLNLRKHKIIRRNTITKNETQSEAEEEVNNNDSVNTDDSKIEENIETDEEGVINDEDETDLNNQTIDSEVPAKKRRKNSIRSATHGKSFTEIPGTPIVTDSNSSIRLPDREKFSENICAHKPYEMDTNTPTGSYQNIVKLTREFKSYISSSNS